MENEHNLRDELEEFVSPSDIPLFDIIAANVDSISAAIGIFKDRNPIPATSSLVLGVIQTVIKFSCGVDVNTAELRHFIVEQNEKNITGGNDDKK